MPTSEGDCEIEEKQSLPGDSEVKNPPASVGDVGSVLIQDDPRATEQLSLCATTIEPMPQSHMPQNF